MGRPVRSVVGGMRSAGTRESGKGAGCVQLSGFWDSLTGFGGGWFPMPRVTCVRGVGSSGVKQIDSGD